MNVCCLYRFEIFSSEIFLQCSCCYCYQNIKKFAFKYSFSFGSSNDEQHSTLTMEPILVFKILFSQSNIASMACDYFTGEDIKQETFKCKCQYIIPESIVMLSLVFVYLSRFINDAG